jgi:hypothetical protein
VERNKRKDVQQQQQQVGELAAKEADELRRLRSSLQLVETERDQLEQTVQELRAELTARREIDIKRQLFRS